MAMTTMKPAMRPLPRAMLIDMDDTILSAYARPEIAWNTITAEFAEELAPLPPQLVASTSWPSRRISGPMRTLPGG